MKPGDDGAGAPASGRLKSHVKISFKRKNLFETSEKSDKGGEMTMNFLNGMQIRQFTKKIVNAFRFSQRLFHENRFPVNIIPVKIDFPLFFSHENVKNVKIYFKR